MNFYSLLFVTLVVFPLGYGMLCRHMDQVLRNPPKVEFFFIFGSIAGYLLLCGLLLPSPMGLLVVLPFSLCAYVALAGSCYSALKATPRTGYHVTAAAISGFFVVTPLIGIVLGQIIR